MPFHPTAIFTLAHLLPPSLAHLPQQKHHLNLLSSITIASLTQTIASFWRKQSCIKFVFTLTRSDEVILFAWNIIFVWMSFKLICYLQRYDVEYDIFAKHLTQHDVMTIDNLYQSTILQKLTFHVISDCSYQWFTRYLTNRQQLEDVVGIYPFLNKLASGVSPNVTTSYTSVDNVFSFITHAPLQTTDLMGVW